MPLHGNRVGVPRLFAQQLAVVVQPAFVEHAGRDCGLHRAARLVLVAAIAESALQRQVTDVTVSGANLVTLRVCGTTVVWGGVAQPEKKLTVMSALLKSRPKLIDVSAPDTPVTR